MSHSTTRSTDGDRRDVSATSLSTQPPDLPSAAPALHAAAAATAAGTTPGTGIGTHSQVNQPPTTPSSTSGSPTGLTNAGTPDSSNNTSPHQHSRRQGVGRQVGALGWRKDDIELAFRLIEDMMPGTDEEWDTLIDRYNQRAKVTASVTRLRDKLHSLAKQVARPENAAAQALHEWAKRIKQQLKDVKQQIPSRRTSRSSHGSGSQHRLSINSITSQSPTDNELPALDVLPNVLPPMPVVESHSSANDSQLAELNSAPQSSSSPADGRRSSSIQRDAPEQRAPVSNKTADIVQPTTDMTSWMSMFMLQQQEDRRLAMRQIEESRRQQEEDRRLAREELRLMRQQHQETMSLLTSVLRSTVAKKRLAPEMDDEDENDRDTRAAVIDSDEIGTHHPF